MFYLWDMTDKEQIKNTLEKILSNYNTHSGQLPQLLMELEQFFIKSMHEVREKFADHIKVELSKFKTQLESKIIPDFMDKENGVKNNHNGL